MFTLKEFLINEAQQRQTKTKPADDWESLFRTLDQQGLSGGRNMPAPAAPSPKEQPRAQPTASLRKASAASTRERAGQVQMSPEMGRQFASMDLNAPDTISDDQARSNAMADTPGHLDQPRLPNPNKVDATNMPALISKAVATTGQDPEWHAVKNLPGYMRSGIRQIGRAVFAPFTSTPIEEINVLANVNGSGPNTQQELDTVLGYLQKNGSRQKDLDMQFQEKIEGYGARIRTFTALGHTFITVVDQHGKYIYSWPTKDGDLDQLDASGPAERPALGVQRPALGNTPR